MLLRKAKSDRLLRLAEDLVRSNVDVVVTLAPRCYLLAEEL
jgi:hypothetical protein